ncbi:IS891/IS1136/IS1341 transposase [Nodularia sp. NIES-3585]|nr:IS891/IS1136/IS1341 transposase [Nodularia sp. NIES-3585]
MARCVIQSHDLVAYEDLRIKNLVKNHCLAKSINDAGWYQFRKWLEYFSVKFSKITVAVNPGLERLDQFIQETGDRFPVQWQ